ncbi:MAG: carboxypeptidase regulatory-like domain-containing protein [Anaerolineae bacterium]|nr:carboxypeptidase regulatory-like domain-containing protein [Anaerolineae bacterium]
MTHHKTFIMLILIVSLVVPVSVQAQGSDPYEPDEENVPWIGLGEAQARSFYPDGDVDRARLRVKAGHWYEVRTAELALLVDTVLTVEVGGTVYENDDGGDEPLASRVTFQAAETVDALITVITSQGVYSTTQTYTLYAGELSAPTPTPTDTPLPTDTPTPTPTVTPTPTLTSTATSTPTPIPTSTPRPTGTPVPTATPAHPVVSFSAAPDRVEKPGDCVMLRWRVERATEVYLIHPNGNREGVVGQDERQVCPVETSRYTLEVYAPGGDETVHVEVAVPLPTPTPTTATQPGGQGSGGSANAGKGTVHAIVFVDENRSQAYDPQEGVAGAVATLMSQADPALTWTASTDDLGQAHFPKVPAGSYTVLIPHLGYAKVVSLRGDELTVDVLVAPIQLPSRLP